MKSRKSLALAVVMTLAAVSVVMALPGQKESPKKRVFIHAENIGQKQALKALIGERGIRHEYVSPGNELTFSAELTRGQVRAVERLGGRIEPVPQVFPMAKHARYGRVKEKVTPDAKPVCGDGKCQRNEPTTCPQDCEAPPPGRSCEPMDQREYQTLLLSGSSAGAGAGSGVKLLVIDTGVYKEHLDLDVTFCRNATGRKVRNNCADDIGHGTHVSGSTAANGGDDGLGIFGAAPGVTLGFEKICTTVCFLDDLIRGIEDGTQNFHPDVMTLSFSASDTSALRNAINAAVADGTLFFASAGNNGPGASTISYPAGYANVVGVGMLDAARIANRMSSRGIDDGNDNVVSEREIEFTGGGFVIESTSSIGCYEILSGTSMSTPSVAGFAAANWQGSNSATRDWLQDVLAEDVNNTGRVPAGYDDTTAGYDTSTGYGLPRTGSGINGGIAASIIALQTVVPQGQTMDISVSGPANSWYRIGITSPAGDWTFGEFLTDGNGNSLLIFTPWTDPGTWLLTVDFGGGATNFGADLDTFQQP